MRKSKDVTITAEGRDKGKTFRLTEAGAVPVEKWAARALSAMASSGIDIPPEVLRMGTPAVLALGARALLTMSFEAAEPLLDEMMTCIELVPDRKKPDITRPTDDEDFEEVGTRLTLRSEVVELHTGFSIAAFLSTLGKAAKTQTPGTENTPT